MSDDAGVFKALADPTRRQILADLRDGELSAGDIAARFPISGPSISSVIGRDAFLWIARSINTSVAFRPIS